MAKKTAPVENSQGGRRTAFTDEQVAHFKSKILELVPQGWTVRQVLAEPDICLSPFAKHSEFGPHI